MEWLVKFRKGFTAGRRKYKKGDYSLIMITNVKKATADVWFDSAPETVNIKLDELLDAVEVIK